MSGAVGRSCRWAWLYRSTPSHEDQVELAAFWQFLACEGIAGKAQPGRPLGSPIPCLPAGKAAFAGKCVRAVSFLQTRLNLRESHFPSARRAGCPRHSRMRGLRRYKHAKPSPDFLVEAGDALAQFVASRQHDPATLDIEVFCFIDLVGGRGGPRPALTRTFVAISNLN